MAIRRRVGVSSAESARRQLMQPVAIWEKVWVPADNTAIKVYKWVRTEKVQHFGDDEGTVDEPLVPLPDEPEIVEGDEEEQDENNTAVEQQQTAAPQEQQEEEPEPEPENSKPSSPKLSMTLQPSAMDDGADADVDNLDPSLQPIGEKLNDDGDGMELGIGPEMDDAHDLSQLDENALMSAGLLDESVDPFATQ